RVGCRSDGWELLSSGASFDRAYSTSLNGKILHGKWKKHMRLATCAPRLPLRPPSVGVLTFSLFSCFFLGFLRGSKGARQHHVAAIRATAGRGCRSGGWKLVSSDRIEVREASHRAGPSKRSIRIRASLPSSARLSSGLSFTPFRYLSKKARVYVLTI